MKVKAKITAGEDDKILTVTITFKKQDEIDRWGAIFNHKIIGDFLRDRDQALFNIFDKMGDARKYFNYDFTKLFHEIKSIT